MKSGRIFIFTFHYVNSNRYENSGIHPHTPEYLDFFISEVSKYCEKIDPISMVHRRSDCEFFDRNYFALTFDDGLKDHFQFVAPILEKHKINASFFVPTRPISDKRLPLVHKIHWLRAHVGNKALKNFLSCQLRDKGFALELSDQDVKRARMMHIHDSTENQNFKFALNFKIPPFVLDPMLSCALMHFGYCERELVDELFMSEADLLNLVERGHTIGMHGHSHFALSRLDNFERRADLERNKRVLESILRESVCFLSYPYGRKDAIPHDYAQLLDGLGIEFGFTLFSEPFNPKKSEKLLIPRYTPNEWSGIKLDLEY